MKIYTKKGDTGLTALATGERVSKHDKRVDLYGTADELNSVIGLSTSILELEKTELYQQLLHELQDQQCLLFELGAELAGFFRNPDSSIIEETDIHLLEESMDQMTAQLPELKQFILPGGTQLAANLHLARTVCRRLERRMTALREENSDYVFAIAIKYINRMSDYLFTAARYSNFLSGIPDVPWRSRNRDHKKSNVHNS